MSKSQEKLNKKLQSVLEFYKAKGVSDVIRRRIIFEAQSESDPNTFLTKARSMVEAENAPRVEGIPCKISLLSDGQCFGPRPAEADPIQQRITLRTDGKAVITYYNFEGKRLNQERFSVDPVQATALIRKICAHFSIHPFGDYVTDIGSWMLTIENMEGKLFRLFGSLLGYRWHCSLSTELREILGRPKLYAFDGRISSPSAIRILHCMFEFGGKKYLYRSDDLSIHEEDQVIVSFGHNNQERTARVMAVEYLEPEDLPISTEQIKTVIKPYGKCREFIVGREATLYDIVKAAMDTMDHEELLRMGCPSDEYDSESRRISERINPEMDRYEIAKVIADVMSSSFGEPYTEGEFLETATWIKLRTGEIFQK